MDVKYIKEPGFIYDLIYMICISLNKDNFYAELKRKKMNNEDDISFYENIINQCGKISEDILPLFYLDKDNPCFILTYYFLNKKDLENFNMDVLISELSDSELFVQNLTEFYFGTVNRYNNDFIDLIDKSNISLNLKYRLTRIYIDIPRISKMIIDVLKQSKPVLESIYNGFNNIVKDKINLFSDEKIIKSLYTLEKLDMNTNSKIDFSICIISRYVCITVLDEIDYFILGDDYIDNIEIIKEDRSVKIDLLALGKIISDPTRLKMFELLKERKEIYTGEMCDILDMTLTAVFYHLNMMLTEKMLKTRNEGRKVFYSINNEYFDALRERLLDFKVR
jgi:ArsR family transcriptional regulator